MRSRSFRVVVGPAEGFTIVELLIGLVLTGLVFGVAVQFLSSQLDLASSRPQAADLHQRARVAADLMVSDLGSAGAWTVSGGLADGFACCIPALHPRRLGTSSPDPPGVARDDTVTVVRLLPGVVPGRVRAPVVSGMLALEAQPACGPSRPLCGLEEGDAVVVFTPDGRHDFFRLGPPAAATAPLIIRQPSGAGPLAAGAVVAGVDTVTYWFDRDARQLRRYDGHRSDMPVIDDVVDVRFEYRGVAGIPPRARGPVGIESCGTDGAGIPRFGRSLAAPDAADIPLVLSEFRDGPWCGDGDNRFDVDLLRIRQIRVVLRLAASSAAVRGTDASFGIPGRATSAARLVPDMEMSVDVAPSGLAARY